MPVLGLISGMQAGPRPLSRCHSGVPALQLSQSRHIPFVSARRSLFTFQWFDIPIRAADYLLASSFSSFPSARPYAVSHLFSFLCQSFIFGHFFFFFFFGLSVHFCVLLWPFFPDLFYYMKLWAGIYPSRSKQFKELMWKRIIA